MLVQTIHENDYLLMYGLLRRLPVVPTRSLTLGTLTLSPVYRVVRVRISHLVSYAHDLAPDLALKATSNQKLHLGETRVHPQSFRPSLRTSAIFRAWYVSTACSFVAFPVLYLPGFLVLGNRLSLMPSSAASCGARRYPVHRVSASHAALPSTSASEPHHHP